MANISAAPNFLELFTPKLVTVLREGYGVRDIKADIVAALTVAIVALPLSMAIAIASGVTPERGLYTSIVGGFVVSALGGSRFQIGGPAGAFIVLVAATVARHGFEGLLVATFLSGMIMLGVGLLRLGAFIKYIPYPVTVAFTFGIAIIIFAGEVVDLLGLKLSSPAPGPIVPKFIALYGALPTVNPAAVSIALLSIAVMVLSRRYRPHWPAYLIAVAIGSVLVWLFHLPVETIGTRFGGIPGSVPLPHWPPLSPERIVEMMPSALSFALLGSIESLLSAVVADSMTGRRHRSNCELVAQGAANIASAFFGGICVTGTIARTATNVRAGARGPISGMLHSLFVLLFILVAAPLARFIPLAALAAVLTVVAWNMAEKHEFATLFRASLGDAVVLVATLGLVVFRDLSEGIIAGFAISALLFLHRMARAVEVEGHGPLIEEDVADFSRAGRVPYDAAVATDPDIVIYRISGAFFFGAASAVAAALDRIGEHPKAYIVDFSAVPMIDSTAAATIKGFVRKAQHSAAKVYLAGMCPPVQHAIVTHGLHPPEVQFMSEASTALADARSALGRARSAVAQTTPTTRGTGYSSLDTDPHT
jgi:sulfate permease, SulP family